MLLPLHLHEQKKKNNTSSLHLLVSLFIFSYGQLCGKIQVNKGEIYFGFVV